MNKHIKKKFLGEVYINDKIEDIINSPKNLINQQIDLENVSEEHYAFIRTNDNRILQAFLYHHNGRQRLIPEPDPILIYFHTAYVNYKRISEFKDLILDSTTLDKMDESAMEYLYDYFGLVSSCVILLFTSLEAIMNRVISKDFIYIKEMSNRTEHYSKAQIERHLSFDEKINKIIPLATGKNFSHNYSNQITVIRSLKEYRDMIVHTKELEHHTTYDYLYKNSFSFDYLGVFNAVKDFCNYYMETDYIENCPCSRNW